MQRDQELGASSSFHVRTIRRSPSCGENASPITPDWVRHRLVSFENPKGGITNSDLKLAGSVAQHDILTQAANVTERTIHNS